MWVRAWSQSLKTSEFFLYDLDQKKVLGQLINGEPVMTLAGKSKVLCARPVPPRGPLHDPLMRFLARISGGRIRYSRTWRDLAHRYWLVDLERNSAVPVGQIPGVPNFKCGRSKCDDSYLLGRWRSA